MPAQSGRSLVERAALIALSLCACVALGACVASNTVQLTGAVVDDPVTVQAPSVPVPSPDLEAGFRSGPLPASGAAAGSGPAAGSPGATPTAVGVTGLGSFARVRAVRVQVGERISAGQVIVVLDTALLDANVRAAKASQRVADAQVPVLDAALDKLATTRADIASSRSTLHDTIAQLRSTRARLVSQLASLRSLLRRVESLPAGGRPGGGIPTTAPPGGVATSTPGGGLPPGGLPDPANLRAGIRQLESAIAQIDAGLVKADAGLVQLSTASAKVSDARAQLRHVRMLARIAAQASAVGVDLAGYQRALAEIRAPVAGTIVSVVSVGDVVAPGATVAEIRRPGPAKVSSWLAPDDLAKVSVGDKAYLSGDWMAGSTPGVVTDIGVRAEYPPTSSATKKVHLTRAVPVEITVDQGRTALPPGTPVDISIVPNSKR